MHVYRVFEKNCCIFFIGTLKIEKWQDSARKFALEGNARKELEKTEEQLKQKALEATVAISRTCLGYFFLY